jgi:hypothetical protein
MFLDYDLFGLIGGTDAQMQTIRDAGFATVDCLWKRERLAIIRAVRPSAAGEHTLQLRRGSRQLRLAHYPLPTRAASTSSKSPTTPSAQAWNPNSNLGAARLTVNKTIVHPEKVTLSKAEHAAKK